MIGLLLGWAEGSLLNSQEFGRRAVAVLDSSTVRQVLAEEITDRLTDQAPTLNSFRTVVVTVVEDVIGTPAFRGILQEAATQAHQLVFDQDSQRVLVNLADSVGVVISTLQIINPDVAKAIPADLHTLAIDLTDELDSLQLWQAADDVDSFAQGVGIVALVAMVGAVFLAPHRRVGVLKVGVAITAAGAGLFALAVAAPGLAVRPIADPDLARGVEAALNSFLGDLRSLALVAMVVGVVLAAATNATAPRSSAVDAVGLGRRARDRWLAWQPTTPAGMAGRGALVVVAGLVLILAREAILPVTVAVVGAYVCYVGLHQVLAVLGRPGTERVMDRREGAVASSAVLRWFGFGIALSVVVVAVGIGATFAVSRARSQASASSVRECNGAAELCDRRLDQVALAGAHNAMSASRVPGWLFAEQLVGIPAQLDQGVRALLVKSHYGIPSGVQVGGAELILSDLSADIAAVPTAASEEISPEAVQRAKDLAASVPERSAPPQVYLCHNYCELGATLFLDALLDVRHFLQRNPDEVIILFIGDYVTPEDTAKVFDQAGLTDRLWTYDTSQPPPTLGEMIDQKRNILVLSEHQGPPPPWYTSGYGIFQDTPFTFADPSQFSCAHNRGPTDAPLFQINHWITTTDPPSPQEAAQVNSYDALLGWVQRCQQERGMFPTIIGVNFTTVGDLMRVVDEVNGVDTGRG
jgi:hypothetical protein